MVTNPRRKTRIINAISRLINQYLRGIDETELASERLSQRADNILNNLSAESASESDIARAIGCLKAIEPPAPYLWTRFDDHCLGENPTVQDLQNAVRRWIETGTIDPNRAPAQRKAQSLDV